jgi:hypothetical protein
VAEKFILHMHSLRKVVPPNKTIVDGVFLSFFFYGTKIPPLGLTAQAKER